MMGFVIDNQISIISAVCTILVIHFTRCVLEWEQNRLNALFMGADYMKGGLIVPYQHRAYHVHATLETYRIETWKDVPMIAGVVQIDYYINDILAFGIRKTYGGTTTSQYQYFVRDDYDEKETRGILRAAIREGKRLRDAKEYSWQREPGQPKKKYYKEDQS